MTTLRQYRGLDELLDRLEAVQFRRRVVVAVTAALAGLTFAIGSLALAAAVGGYWPGQPPVALRWVLLAICAVTWAAALAWPVAAAILSAQEPTQTARFIEQSNPKVRNDLINALLLAGDEGQVSPLLVQLAIRESLLRSRRVKLAKAVSLVALRRWAVAAAVAAAAVVVLAVAQSGAMQRGLAAVLSPGSYVPTASGVTLAELTPGDATVFAGQDVTITAVLSDGRAADLPAAVIVEGRAEPLPMAATDRPGAFGLTLPAIDRTTRYAVTIGNSRWPTDKPWYTITVLAGATVENISVRYDYPAYSGLAGKTVEHSDGTIEALAGSRATVTVTLDHPPGQAAVELRDGQAIPMSPSPDGRTFAATLAVEKDSAYRIMLRDRQGRTIQQVPAASGSPAAQGAPEGYFRIRAIPDRPPLVRFLAPGRHVQAAPGGTVPLKIAAADDFGLTSVELVGGKDGSPAKRIANFIVSSQRQAALDHALVLDPALREGDVVVYHATASDNRNCPGIGGPQTAASEEFKIFITNAAVRPAAHIEQELRERLLAILRMQETQRVATAICIRAGDATADVAARGASIAAGQRKIRDGLADLAGKLPWTAELTAVRDAVTSLAGNEGRLAFEQATVVAGLAGAEGRQQAYLPLAATQDKIIRRLQLLLSILPSLQAASPVASTEGHDLPADVSDRLRQLSEQLQQFSAAQLKAIQAGQELAARPLDAFTADDEKLLAELKATQDDWAKFLSEAFADFSKLAAQDFSNPVLLAELISVRCDVTMAADALEAKAFEVATALEDNGLQDAKVLTSNIEKWLPDRPDRQKWSMEDTTEQRNVEQAELPSQLEDLIGDLLEQEEDLFDEMQDLTGKYAASMDKGVGWDAMDGPISSMNAQGVTGNQLPNSSELAGRSGEGRTGKSSGEYVEDKAVGKGGRRTPTRLGNEPFQQGHIDDRSGESAGGATGGGKVSASGAEGLEGPVPPPLADEMVRLAGRQASLTSRAERAAASFQQNDYANFAFLQAVTLMNRVHDDLRAYRYRNVLRARAATLEAMKQTSRALAGGIEVSSDASSAVPKYVRDRISDASTGPLPEQYRDVLEQYYRRLAEGDAVR